MGSQRDLLESVRRAIALAMDSDPAGSGRLDPAALTADTRLSELAIDSVAAMEVGAHLHDEAGVVLTEAELVGARSLSDWMCALESSLRDSEEDPDA